MDTIKKKSANDCQQNKTEDQVSPSVATPSLADAGEDGLDSLQQHIKHSGPRTLYAYELDACGSHLDSAPPVQSSCRDAGLVDPVFCDANQVSGNLNRGLCYVAPPRDPAHRSGN